MAKGAAQDWLLIPAADGGISGVASRSTDKPIKTANFPMNFNKFNGVQAYSEWVFEYVPQPPATGPRPGG
jgi:hypothetical protein